MRGETSARQAGGSVSSRPERRPHSAGSGRNKEPSTSSSLEPESNGRPQSARLAKQAPAPKSPPSSSFDGFTYETIDETLNRRRVSERNGDGFPVPSLPAQGSPASGRDSCREIDASRAFLDFDVFEVAFESTGPLGITFEWGEDFTSWTPSASPEATMADTSGVRTKAHSTLHTNPSSRAASSRDTKPLSRMVSGACVSPGPAVEFSQGSSSPSTEPPVLPQLTPPSSNPVSEAVAHALQIRGFPDLAGGDSHPARGALISCSVGPVLHVGTESSGEKATRIRQQDRRRLLRAGDVLVAVNGTPLAGPEARAAGVNSFGRAVELFKASMAFGRPRVLKFRRARPSTFALSPPTLPSLARHRTGSLKHQESAAHGKLDEGDKGRSISKSDSQNAATAYASARSIDSPIFRGKDKEASQRSPCERSRKGLGTRGESSAADRIRREAR